MKRTSKGLPAIYLAMLGLAPLQAQAVRVDYTVAAGVERNDNVLMSADDPATSTAARAGLGFMVSEDTSAVQANAVNCFVRFTRLRRANGPPPGPLCRQTAFCNHPPNSASTGAAPTG